MLIMITLVEHLLMMLNIDLIVQLASTDGKWYQSTKSFPPVIYTALTFVSRGWRYLLLGPRRRRWNHLPRIIML